MEIFVDVKGYEGLYKVSNYGKVLSVKSGKVRKNCKKTRKCGKIDFYVNLHKNNQEKRFAIHRLVGEAFVPNPERKTQINHIDGNPSNNHYSNLEWVTPYENIRHAIENKLQRDRRTYEAGSKPKGILIYNQNERIEFKSIGECAEYLDKENKKSVKNCLSRAVKKGYKVKGYTVELKV
ncbi:HNH endonuclease [uncultured Clostridium sp.]|uniref:HNH endonuclease n=1 Tax=uncultured Clostridium sp. TaxID=59620 RepID=UPI00261D6B49|nr:HNH endonuclease [uncultured Clostridium sp.]